MAKKRASETRAEKQRRYAARRNRIARAGVSDIGEIPRIFSPKRRAACRRDLFRFLTTYFPESTGLSPLSDDHRRVIERLQTAIMEGGTFTNAVFRGFAKTTISENATLWATLYGHRRFPVVLGASADASESIIDSIKTELADNDLLFEDFPEVCHPIRALENKSQRCASQTCKGELTHIEWKADMIVLPTVKGSLASGAIIATRPMMGAGRGMKFKRPDGKQQRPDFVMVDDPQTDESAASPLQTTKRLNIFRKSILKLGGHNSRIACVVNGTVIEPGDMIEQLLDPKKFPAFQGERIKMVKRWADAHETLWLGEYREIRNRFDPTLVGDQQRAWIEASEFYRRNREEMDRGCIVSWAHCFDSKWEISAIQHAYNMLIDDGEDVFASECQNEPRRREDTEGETLTSAGLAKQLNTLERGVIPATVTRLVAHIDVMHNVLVWTLAGIDDSLGGAVVDYGAWPDQRKAYFTKREIQHTIQQATGTKDLQAAAYAAIRALIADLGGRTYRREDGTPVKIVRGLVDASDGRLNKTILRAVKDSAHPTIFMPSYGRYFGVNAKPMSEWAVKDGDRRGLNWHVSRPSVAGDPRYLTYHTNYWKSVAQNRLGLLPNTAGAMTIFGREAGGKAASHDMLFAHYTSESAREIEDVKTGKRAIEFKPKPNRDNDLWDNLVGCYVAASEQGATPFGPAAKRVYVKYSERLKQKQANAH